MIKEVRHLHDLGFAIHWVKPKSKAPVESGWTKGNRKSWPELMDAYRVGYNVGVRLGSASKLKDGKFLGVIDCDVKSDDPKHQQEMEGALNEILQGKSPKGISRSGRGNGSRHVLCRSDRPLTPRRCAASSHKVRVLMPSVRPSKSEISTLTPSELESGIRIRAAWEISIMGEGQQVVLPPSIHPDSGRSYEWEVPVNSEEDLVLFEDAGALSGKAQGIKEPAGSFKYIDNVDISRLSLRQREIITTGSGVEDRSAALFGSVIAMLREGFSDDEIVSVFTNPDFFLGAAAYDHAKTKDRARAGAWLKKYTLEKARREISADKAFEDDAVISDLDDSQAEKQRAEVLDVDWYLRIERAGEDQHPKTSLKNINLILENALGVLPFRKNLFSNNIEYAVAPPWNKAKVGSAVSDVDVIDVMHWLALRHRLESNDKKILQAITHVAEKNSYHPVRDYLRGLEWDGRPRLDSWLETYLGATGPKEYVEAIGRKTLCAMIARVMVPGIKFDQVLILEGVQGVGKSTTARILASPWFSDAHIDIGNKDAVLAMQSVWILELGELSSVKRADLETVKSFVTRQTDRIRLPYGRIAVDLPRQCVFLGTTNKQNYFTDATGNRRFWPVNIGKCEFKKLERDRDQLLAEALFCWELQEPLYLENREVEKLAEGEQADRTFTDLWAEKLQTWLEKPPANFDPKRFLLSELFSEGAPFQFSKESLADQHRVGEALRWHGYKKVRVQEGKIRKVLWVKQGG